MAPEDQNNSTNQAAPGLDTVPNQPVQTPGAGSDWQRQAVEAVRPPGPEATPSLSGQQPASVATPASQPSSSSSSSYPNQVATQGSTGTPPTLADIPVTSTPPAKKTSIIWLIIGAVLLISVIVVLLMI